MKDSNPFRVVAFVGGVTLILGLFAVLLPKEGLNLGIFHLHLLPVEEWAKTKKQEKVDITKIVDAINIKPLKEEKRMVHNRDTKGNLGAPSIVNYDINSATSLELNHLAQANLNHFFHQLKNLSVDKKKVHILHYGDSQIEGDRMTDFIRQRLQEKFGGYGPGLIPANNVYGTQSFRQTYSDNFLRYTCFGGPKVSNKQYGVMNSVARFTPEFVDSTATVQTGWIQLNASGSAYERAQTFNQVNLFYNACKVPCRLKVYQGGQLMHEENLVTDGSDHVVKLNFGGTPGTLKFHFTSLVSPNIVGFSMEGDYGVQVDNIAMRGSSGTFFGSISKNSFSNMFQKLDVGMVIMQFGGNSLPYLRDSSACRKHARIFQKQLEILKGMQPELAIVMIGPSDMSKLMNGERQTYPLLPYWVEQLKKCAVDAGVAYWDLYDAMGGKNSMPAWVEKDLGKPDYVHFSAKGASMAAQLFYDSFIQEFIQVEEK